MAGRPFPFEDKEFASDLPSNIESSDITSSTLRTRSSSNPNSPYYSPSSSTGSSHGAHYSSLNPNSPSPPSSFQLTESSRGAHAHEPYYPSYTAPRVTRKAEEHAHEQQKRVASASVSETYHLKFLPSSRKSDTAPKEAEEHAHEQQEWLASRSASDHDLFHIKAADLGVLFSKQRQTNNISSDGGRIVGEGITLTVPPGAVPSGSVDISLQACLDGPFCLPEDLEFVSPVYLIEPHSNFRKDVTLAISTFLEAQTQKDTENIVFVYSPVNNRGSSSWYFRISGASPRFEEGSRIGEVKIVSFLLQCIC